ncbi:TPA: LPD7 domain-containing protein [Klebsiella pneumoniae]
MSKDNDLNDFEQAFNMEAAMPDFPDYEIVGDNVAPAAAPVKKPEPEPEVNLEHDMMEVKSRIDSFKDVLNIGDKFGMSDEQRKMIKNQLSELELTYVKLQKTLNLEEPAPTASLIEPKKPEEAKPTVPAAVVSAADSIPAQDFTDLDKFTQMKNEEAKHPVKAKSLKDRIKSVRSNIREEEEGEIKKDNRPQYVKDFEKNLMPETELNVKTNGRSRYLTNDELKNLFGDNYLHSRDNIEEGKLTSRTHYFGDGLLIKETEDAIAIRGRRKANDIAVDLIDVAKQKGWNSIVLTKGNPVFMEQAYISAIKNGIRVEATSLKQEEEFQMIHKAYDLDRYMKFSEPKKEEIKKEELMPEYQVKRGRSLKM